MSKKSALGRGLEALLPGSPADTTGSDSPAGTPLYDFNDRPRVGRVSEVSLDDVRANPFQPRENFDDDALNDLANSIRELGIIQPITVRQSKQGYELISGERRVRAARMAGLSRVPAYVRDADSETMLEMAIVENVQREELDPIEIALGYDRLIQECGLTQEKVAVKVGKNRTTVTNFLRLLGLPPAIQAGLREGDITVGHARALLSVDNIDDQETLFEIIRRESLNVRQVEERARRLQSAATPSTKKKKQPVVAEATDIPHRDKLEIQSFVDLLRAHFATQVHIKPQGADGGGRIELHYYSAEDLERLVEQLLAS